MSQDRNEEDLGLTIWAWRMGLDFSPERVTVIAVTGVVLVFLYPAQDKQVPNSNFQPVVEAELEFGLSGSQRGS
jgi:hypothetical protein